MFIDFHSALFITVLVFSFTSAVYAMNRSYGDALVESLVEAIGWGGALLIYSVVDYALMSAIML